MAAERRSEALVDAAVAQARDHGGEIPFSFMTWGSASISDVANSTGYFFTKGPDDTTQDPQVVELLKKDGIQIARRTVAKYRDMLRILPSSKRKKMF